MNQLETLTLVGGGIALAVLLFLMTTRKPAPIPAAATPAPPPPPTAATAVNPQPAAARPPTTSGGTLLIVDDDEAVRVTTAMILQDFGYSVLACESGQSALDVLGRQPEVSLLLTDVVMPEMNGAELARRARALRASLPIVFFSGYADPNTAAGEAVLTPLLRKPFRARELVAEIEAALAGGRAAKGGT